MKYKYIYMVKIPAKTKTKQFEIRNIKSDDRIGVVKWYASWRQYCFFPNGDCVFSVGCLNDIMDFIKMLAQQGGDE